MLNPSGGTVAPFNNGTDGRTYYQSADLQLLPKCDTNAAGTWVAEINGTSYTVPGTSDDTLDAVAEKLRFAIDSDMSAFRTFVPLAPGANTLSLTDPPLEDGENANGFRIDGVHAYDPTRWYHHVSSGSVLIAADVVVSTSDNSDPLAGDVWTLRLTTATGTDFV